MTHASPISSGAPILQRRPTSPRAQFTKADQAGYAAAQVNLGVFYKQGLGGLAKDDREAVRLYKLAADQGDAFGQANLGVFYEQGRGGLEKDDREAGRLYKLAADQGNAFGQAYLGDAYRDGQGGLIRPGLLPAHRRLLLPG
jgi:hypothetical protein